MLALFLASSRSTWWNYRHYGVKTHFDNNAILFAMKRFQNRCIGERRPCVRNRDPSSRNYEADMKGEFFMGPMEPGNPWAIIAVDLSCVEKILSGFICIGRFSKVNLHWWEQMKTGLDSRILIFFFSSLPQGRYLCLVVQTCLWFGPMNQVKIWALKDDLRIGRKSS